MPGLVPGIHVFATRKIVDGRVKPGHDEVKVVTGLWISACAGLSRLDVARDCFAPALQHLKYRLLTVS